jgi:hypothetical protein
LSFPTLFDGHYLGNRLRLEDKRYPKKSFSFLVIFFFGCAVHIVFSITSKVFLPVNNSLIDYPVKRYDRAFDLASDVINENFTYSKVYFLLPLNQCGIWVETLFGIFKTRGFCLESTHFTDPKRLHKLLALLTLAWSLKTGLAIHHLHPIPLKKHGRRAQSLFRLGFDHLSHLVLNPSLPNFSLFLDSLHFLSCT